MTFKKTLMHSLEFEGGYANVAGDRGGETFRGIARNIWPQWPGWAKVDEAKGRGNLTAKAIDRYFANDDFMAEMVADFYYQNFWQLFEKFDLPERVRAKLFDTSINTGPKPAVKFLQRSINKMGPLARVADDGAIGPKTMAALKQVLSAPESEDILLGYMVKEQSQYYQNIVSRKPNQSKFLKGWLRRAEWRP